MVPVRMAVPLAATDFTAAMHMASLCAVGAAHALFRGLCLMVTVLVPMVVRISRFRGGLGGRRAGMAVLVLSLTGWWWGGG